MSIVGQQRKIYCNVDLVEVGMENWGNVSEIVKSATKVTTLYNKKYILVFKFIYATFLAATKQLYKWYFPSVCPSVRLYVRLSVTPFWLCSHHRIIMKFSGVITNDEHKVHAKVQGQRSKVKVTEVTTQLNRFRTVTPFHSHMKMKWCI